MAQVATASLIFLLAVASLGGADPPVPWPPTALIPDQAPSNLPGGAWYEAEDALCRAMGRSLMEQCEAWVAPGVAGGVRATVVHPVDGRIFLAGNTSATAPGATVRALDPATGKGLWDQDLGDDGPDDLWSLARVGTDRLAVTGVAAIDGTHVAHVAVLDSASGSVVWSRTYPRDLGDGVAYRVGATPDGARIIVAGWELVGYRDHDIFAAGLDAATGDEVWRTSVSGTLPGYDRAWALDIRPQGDLVFVAGDVYNDTPEYRNPDDAVVLALDPRTGRVAWTARYDHPVHSTDRFVAVASSPSGDAVFAVGGSSSGNVLIGGTALDWVVAAYDAHTGGERWTQRHNGEDDDLDEARRLAITPDERTLVVTGRTRGAGDGDQATTIAYDAATGAVRWTEVFDGDGGDHIDFPYGLAIHPTGQQAYVALWMDGEYGASGGAFGTLAYNVTTGAMAWRARWAGGLIPATAVLVPDGSRLILPGNHPGDGIAAYDPGGPGGMLRGHFP